jgi:hypothetical protein
MRLFALAFVFLTIFCRSASAEKVLLDSSQLEALLKGDFVFTIEGPKGPVTFTFKDDSTWFVTTGRGNKAAGGWKITGNALCRNEVKHSENWEGLDRKKVCVPLFREGRELFYTNKAIPMQLEDPAVLARLDTGVSGGEDRTAAIDDERASLAKMRAQLELERAQLARERATSSGDGERVADLSKVDWGRYHALVIGIDDYASLPKLQTALADARAVAKILREQYGYTVKLLANPTRDDIIDEFDRLRDNLTEEDNLLIYYGGHGWLDRQSGRGYWLPVDADNERRSRWLANTSLTDTLQALLAKHVMVVVDSCFSGTLTRSISVPEHNPSYFARMMEKRTRVVLSSGGLEPVEDAGKGGHSVFAAEFLQALKDNQDVLDGTQLFEKVRRSVILNAQQTPQYSDIRFAGHEGGDFLFVRKR